MKNYLEITGQTDEGVRISSNTETSGRYHTDWLNMMYPRLILAKNLLAQDGVIFLSIDGTEASNLEHLLNNVFGEENKITSICWQKKVSPANDAKWFSSDHDFILVYAKNKDIWRPKSLNALAISYLIIRTLTMILKENGILQRTHVIKACMRGRTFITQ